MATTATDDYVTVREAAGILRVGQSTIRRWIREERVPAYRLGQRRVLLKRAELSRLLSPAHAKQESSEERILVPRLTREERARGLAAVAQLRRLHRELLEERGGRPFSDSLEILHAMRDQRSRERS